MVFPLRVFLPAVAIIHAKSLGSITTCTVDVQNIISTDWNCVAERDGASLKRLDASHGCGSIWESNCDRGDFEEYEAADNSDFSVAKKFMSPSPQLWTESFDEGEVFVGGVQPVGGYIGDEWDVATGSFVYLREVSSPSPSSKAYLP